MSQLMEGISSHSSAVLNLTSCELTKDFVTVVLQSMCFGRRSRAGQGEHRSMKKASQNQEWVIRSWILDLPKIFWSEETHGNTSKCILPNPPNGMSIDFQRALSIWTWCPASSIVAATPFWEIHDGCDKDDHQGWDLTAIAMGTIPKWPSFWMILGTCWFTQMIAGISHDIPWWSWMDLIIIDYLCISSKHWV
jgi:hypothetical protein